MAKTENVFVRVEPQVKKQAEAVLQSLGIPMSNAIGMFLQQVVLQRGIPFDVKLPKKGPIFWDELSEEERDALLAESVKEYQEGNVVSVQDVRKRMHEVFGV